MWGSLLHLGSVIGRFPRSLDTHTGFDGRACARDAGVHGGAFFAFKFRFWPRLCENYLEYEVG